MKTDVLGISDWAYVPFEATWTSNLGRSCSEMGPSCGQVAPSWMSDRNGRFKALLGQSAKGGNYQSRALFGSLPPQLKLYQSDRSVRPHPLLNYHASAHSVRADSYNQSDHFEQLLWVEREVSRRSKRLNTLPNTPSTARKDAEEAVRVRKELMAVKTICFIMFFSRPHVWWCGGGFDREEFGWQVMTRRDRSRQISCLSSSMFFLLWSYLPSGSDLLNAMQPLGIVFSWSRITYCLESFPIHHAALISTANCLRNQDLEAVLLVHQ